MPENDEYVKFKSYERKAKSLYLSEVAVQNFINSMIEESKYCSNVVKNYFKEELVISMLNQKIPVVFTA